MLFDFDKFSDITASVYPGGTYTLEEALEVFRYFFQQYEECIGEVHPPIRVSQIVRICQDMPYIFLQDRGESYIDVTPEDYTALIDNYFQTEFYNCDYRINHFFSGRVREMRYYAACY